MQGYATNATLVMPLLLPFPDAAGEAFASPLVGDASAACGAHDTNGMYDMDVANKNISVSGLRRRRDRTSTGLGCCWCALSSAKHLSGAGDACVRGVMLVVAVGVALTRCVERCGASTFVDDC